MITTAVGTMTVAAVLAACGGGSNAGSTSGGHANTTVSAEQIGGSGTVLVDRQGKALYASDQEAGGKVLCTGACNSFWKPLTIGSGMPTSGSLTGKVGVVKRPDGSRQVTYNGKLLYSFELDQPGQVKGNNFSDAFNGQHFKWHVVHSNGSVSSSGGSTGSGSGSFGY
jgi:predicted lipoprotein with Yx(FWY)xxD motif